ncbi:MAG: hypothetical protein ACPGN3_02980 [Opitutales bacterium]
MRAWPSILYRRSHPNESTILWDSGVFVFLAGLPILIALALLDQTLINDEPRWIKPIKFFSSIAIYNLTLEWLFRVFRTEKNTNAFNRIRWIVGIGMLVETALLLIQATRGVQSHFNIATPFDLAVFSAMGIIITLVVSSVLVSAYFIWKARDQAPHIISEGVVLGIILMTFASFQGFTMTSPTPEQLEGMKVARPQLSGSHHVGIPPKEDHATVPFAGWSLDVGDLRIPHFVGLHSLQIFLLFAIFAHSLRIPSGLLILRSIALGYGALFLYSLLRALGGQPFI